MNIARKALAVAAVAGFGMAGFAAQANAEGTNGVAPRPAAQAKAAGDWVVAITDGDIKPRTIQIQTGATYTVTGKVEAAGTQAKGNWTVKFNTAPGAGNIGCTATATGGGVVSGGTITWSNVDLGTAAGTYTITCTYKNAYTPVVNEKVTLTAAGHVYQGETKPLVDTQVVDYTIGGTLPSGSATPKPSTSSKPSASAKPSTSAKPTTPVKDKDSKGGLAKTGF